MFRFRTSQGIVAEKLANRVAKLKIGDGFSNDENLNQVDWNGDVVHIHTLFVTKCAYFMWLKDTNENGQVGRINLRNGEVEFVDRSTREHQSARLIRNIK